MTSNDFDLAAKQLEECPSLDRLSAAGCDSSVVMRCGHPLRFEIQRDDLSCADVEDAIDSLQGPRDLEQRRLVKRNPKALCNVGREYGIGESGLVLQRHEAVALRGTRSLPNDRMSRCADKGSIGYLAESCGGQDAAAIEALA
jgi:hypothetical protein